MFLNENEQHALLPVFSEKTDLSEFLSDLRMLVFASTPKAADYFALKSHTTVVRYEQGKITPPVGYLAGLARLVTERLGNSGDGDASHTLLLRYVNRAVLRCFPGEEVFTSWTELCRAADTYIGRQKLAQLPTRTLPMPASVAAWSRTRHLRPNPLFVGREDVLHTIGGWLAQEPQNAPPVLVISGMAGLGKSQLAVETMHRYGPFFAGGVFWLSFADLGAVSAEVAECGRMGHLDLHPDFARLPIDDQVRLVRAAWQEPLPRLLIFDNCEDEQTLAAWRPHHGGCRILVTSRRSRWNPALAVRVEPLDVLQRGESVRLLGHYRPDLANDSVLEEVAATLGDLPLALHLAGSYLHTYDDAPQAYLAQLNAARLVVHPSLQAADRPFSPTAHQQHVADAIALSYERLDPANPIDLLARTLLMRIACFAPGEAVPRLLFDETCATDEVDKLDRAIQRLSALALVRVEQNDAIWMHRLVADFVHAHAFDPAVQTLVEAALVRVVKRHQTIDDNSTLLSLQPHMRWVTETALPRRDHQAVELCYWLCYHLWQIVDLAAAQRYLEQTRAWLLTADDVVGRMDLANITELLGLVFQMQSDFRAARTMYEQGLMVRTQALGPDHIETATSHNNLGHVLNILEEPDEAWFHLKRSLQIRLKVLGKESADAARTLNNLGYILMQRGRFAAAERFFRFVLEIRQRILSPVTVATAQTLNNVGDACIAQGNYSEALIYHQQALAMRLQLFGEQHNDSAESYRRLGEVLIAQHQFADALAILEQAHAIDMAVLGPDNIETLLIMTFIGEALHGLQRYDEARSALQQTLTQLSAKFGAQHYWIEDTYKQLCRLEIATAHWEAAREYAEQLMTIPHNAVGKPHPRIATAYYLLGQVFQGQGNRVEALAHYEQALALALRLLGPAHPQTRIVQASVDALDEV